VASSAKSELGSKPRYNDLCAIVEMAWNWHRRHPREYINR
jgi:UDP-glucose 4-epimerase